MLVSHLQMDLKMLLVFVSRDQLPGAPIVWNRPSDTNNRFDLIGPSRVDRFIVPYFSEETSQLESLGGADVPKKYLPALDRSNAGDVMETQDDLAVLGDGDFDVPCCDRHFVFANLLLSNFARH